MKILGISPISIKPVNIIKSNPSEKIYSSTRAYATTQVNFGNKRDKLINKILRNHHNKVEITYEQLKSLLESFGFEELRIKGSHAMFSDKKGNAFGTAVTLGVKKYLDPGCIKRLQDLIRKLVISN